MSKSGGRKNIKSDAGRHVYTGKLEVVRSGMGFVAVEGLDKDILIKRENLDMALSGDEVRVEVKGYFDNNRRPDGKIIEVVRRKQSEFSGKVEVHPHFAFLVPDSDKMPVD